MERSKSNLRLDLRAKGVSAVTTFNTLDKTVLDLISITRRSHSIEDSNSYTVRLDDGIKNCFILNGILFEKVAPPVFTPFTTDYRRVFEKLGLRYNWFCRILFSKLILVSNDGVYSFKINIKLVPIPTNNNMSQYP